MGIKRIKSAHACAWNGDREKKKGNIKTGIEKGRRRKEQKDKGRKPDFKKIR